MVAVSILNAFTSYQGVCEDNSWFQYTQRSCSFVDYYLFKYFSYWGDPLFAGPSFATVLIVLSLVIVILYIIKVVREIKI